jgi:hypothetical protein
MITRTTTVPRRSRPWRWLLLGCVLSLIGVAFWLYASITEMQTGRRIWPWNAYAFCGRSQPTTLPLTVRIGLYEEFPTPARLSKLGQLDFPVTLAVAATSRSEFLRLRTTILQTYPQVREVYFWPVLAAEEGYYPGAWSEPVAIHRLIAEAADQPLLWDNELPRGTKSWQEVSLGNWWANRTTLAKFFAQHGQPIDIWRTHTSMGLNPAFLRLAALHFDPLDYPNVRLHLDLYATGDGQDAGELTRIVRCGLERYGERFIPSLGVFDDGEGPKDVFVPPATFRRDLQIVRAAGATEIWLFGVNGLNRDYLDAIHATIPLESLPTSRGRQP